MIVRVLQIAAVLVLRGLGLFVPRTNQIWIFGGNRGLRFADNSMYFFKYCRSQEEVRSIWLTRSRAVVDEVRSLGGEVYLIPSIRGIWFGLRGGWHFFDVDANDTGPTHDGANCLNLWHGCPLKDISRLGMRRRPRGRVWEWCRRVLLNKNGPSRQFFLHPNRRYLHHITDSFEVPAEHVVTANLPRNIVFEEGFSEATYLPERARELVDRLRSLRSSGARVLGYFPTWRGGNDDRFLGVSDVDSLSGFNRKLERLGFYLLAKWHTCLFPAYQHDGQGRVSETAASSLEGQSRFIMLGFDDDLNSYLHQCDILITDYSSVLFDFLLADRPQLFLAYDLEAYRSRWGFFFDYESLVPGPICRSHDELGELLEELARAPAEFAERDRGKRRRLRDEIFEDPASE